MLSDSISSIYRLNELYRQIAVLGRKFGASRIVLFGSRARGDAQERSDIDLAVYDLPAGTWSDFEDAVDACLLYTSDAADD